MLSGTGRRACDTTGNKESEFPQTATAGSDVGLERAADLLLFLFFLDCNCWPSLVFAADQRSSSDREALADWFDESGVQTQTASDLGHDRGQRKTPYSNEFATLAIQNGKQCIFDLGSLTDGSPCTCSLQTFNCCTQSGS